MSGTGLNTPFFGGSVCHWEQFDKRFFVHLVQAWNSALRCAVRRPSNPHTFEENLATERAKLEAQLAVVRPGPEMDALRKKVRQLEIASHMSEWLSSPGLQSPK
jgi:hypothetical protein